jgi:SAM-dependent methyltransferase
MTFPNFWHKRYAQQVIWTKNLRQHLFSRLNLPNQARILEVGCGTGAVLAALRAELSPNQPELFGVDIQLAGLHFTQQQQPGAFHLAGGSGFSLPFPDEPFDVCLCHFLLMWLSNPADCLAEMIRVTHPGGWVIALAEPDHAARIDAPQSLVDLGKLQTLSLADQGANPKMGRDLKALFLAAGLEQVSAGVLGGEWNEKGVLPDGWAFEWDVLRTDLKNSLTNAQLDELKETDRRAWLHGDRILYVPLFYACGKVPQENVKKSFSKSP